MEESCPDKIFPPNVAGGDAGALGEDEFEGSPEVEDNRPGQQRQMRGLSPNRPGRRGLLAAPAVPPAPIPVGAEGFSSRAPLRDLDW